MDDRSIQAVHRGTVVKGEGDLPRGEAHVMDCHDSLIYLLCPLTHVNISACSDCTVVVGAVGGVLRIERCEKVQVRSGWRPGAGKELLSCPSSAMAVPHIHPVLW